MSFSSLLSEYVSTISLSLLSVVWVSMAYDYRGSGTFFSLAALVMCLLSLGGAAHELWGKRDA